MDLHDFEKRKPDPTKLMVLVELREKAGLTQDKAGELVGLKGARRRNSVSAWETGASRPALKRRSCFIGYLLDGLQLRGRPERFRRVWDDIMVKEWHWPPLTDEELPPPNPPGAQPPPSVSPGDLPPERTPFVERKTELDEIRKLLKRHDIRWLTLTGIGGTGKTRLALRVAAGLVDEYQKQVRWVELEDIDDPAMVMSAIAKVLKVPESGGIPLLEALKYALREGKWLLVLDNLEHVGDARSEVSQLLDAVFGLKVLATSRTPLSIGWERLYPVPLMKVPDADTLPPVEQLIRMECVSLFVQTVQRIKPDFELDAENAKAVVQICVRLVGLPLAIELVALSIRYYTHSPQALLNQLEKHPLFKMPLPVAGLSDTPARHRSLSAAFEWSYELLPPGARALFECLSVFVGGFTVDDVNAVCAELLSAGDSGASGRDLGSLVDHGLVVSSLSSVLRYTLLAVVREYAAERLEKSGRREKAREWHATRFLVSLEAWSAKLKGRDERKALVWMESELGNLRAAWEWALDQANWDKVERAAEPLARYYGACGRGAEACRLFCQAAERLSGLAVERTDVVPGETRTLIELLNWQAHFELGDLARLDLVKRCEELLDLPAMIETDTRRQRTLFLRRFAFALAGEDTTRAHEMLIECLDLSRELEDRWAIAVVLLNMGEIACAEARLQEAGRRLEQSLDHFRRLEDQRGIATCLYYLHLAYGWQQRRLAEAERVVEERMSLAFQWDDVTSLAHAYSMLAGVRYIAGRFTEASKVFADDAMPRWEALGDRAEWAYWMAWWGHVQQGCGDYEEGCKLATSSLALGRKLNHRRIIIVALPVLARHALLEKRYEDAGSLYKEALAVADRAGYRWPEIFYGGEWAVTLLQIGHQDAARQRLCETLRAADDEECGTMPINVLSPAALWLVTDGQAERAVEVYALANGYPHIENSRWVQAVFGPPVAGAEATLPPQVARAAEACGQARDLQATVHELLDELECSAGS